MEAREPSLSLRRLKLFLNYVSNLKSHPDNPAYNCVFEPQNAILFKASPKKNQTFRSPNFTKLEEIWSHGLIHDASVLNTAAWTLPVPSVRLDLATFEKKKRQQIQ